MPSQQHSVLADAILNMEIEKPLRDWEMSCLAERMSPMEFDRIALRYLEMTKVLICFHKFMNAKAQSKYYKNIALLPGTKRNFMYLILKNIMSSELS